MGGIGKKRKKHRTHVIQEEKLPNGQPIPKSMVVLTQSSLAGTSVKELTHDIRKMMGPYTAVRLKERKKNHLRDYLTMSGPLGVSHLVMVSQAKEGGPNLRILKTPRGPTFQFKIHEYVLNKDMVKLQKRPHSGNREFLSPPLLVLDNFNVGPDTIKENPQENLLVTMLQSIFPPVMPNSASLNSVKRVILLHKDDKTDRIELRQYIIGIKTRGVSKPIQKIIQNKIPNLHRAQDIADIFELQNPDSGGSESEAEVVSSSSKDNTKLVKAVSLHEIGPRLSLSLWKIMEGPSDGKILYHSSKSKTQEEITKQEEDHIKASKLREARRKEQQANVDKKRKKGVMKQPNEEEEEEDPESKIEWDDMDESLDDLESGSESE